MKDKLVVNIKSKYKLGLYRALPKNVMYGKNRRYA